VQIVGLITSVSCSAAWYNDKKKVLNLYCPRVGILNPPAAGGDLGIQDFESPT